MRLAYKGGKIELAVPQILNSRMATNSISAIRNLAADAHKSFEVFHHNVTHWLNKISAEGEEHQAAITKLRAEVAAKDTVNTAVQAENADLRAQIATMQADPQEVRNINYHVDIAPKLRTGETVSVEYNGRVYSSTYDDRHIIAPNGMRFNHPGGWSKTIYDVLKDRRQTTLRRHKTDLKAFYVMRNGIKTKLTDLVE